MRVLLQRVQSANVKIDCEVKGQVGSGLLLLVGVKGCDTTKDADYLVEKCLNMRIFENEEGKFDKSVLDVKGEVLIVSQFTLFADTRKGRRPGFSDAAVPGKSIPLYEYFVEKVHQCGVSHVATGEFGADMKVELVNDGPVTIMIDSEDKYVRQPVNLNNT